MTHGYDDQGSRFGADGNFANWWSEADAKGFAERTGKLVEQFDGYEALPGLKVNGKLTLGENIADLGGLATAYDAMKAATAGTPDPMTDGMTRDQRFFISYAIVWRMNYTDQYAQLLVNIDPHAPSRYRVNGPLANFPAFAETFDVPEGAPMSRTGDDLVKIW